MSGFIEPSQIEIFIVNKKLNLIEFLAARYSHFHKLMYAVESKIEQIDIKEKVSREIKKRIKKGDYKYLNEMSNQIIEKLTRKESKSERILKYLTIVFITFIVSSLGEGLVQDLWLEDVKNFLCNSVNFLCE